MFSKPAKATSTTSRLDALEAPRKAIAMSLIAENVSVDGDIASEGDIQLDGAVRGDLKVAHLSIGETGQIEGAISADAVDVRGRVAGTITAKTVRLFATAKVDGDITHSQLTIEAGAHFAGRSVKLGETQQEQLSLPMAAE
ncbi:MAG TPA: polymer-forming cytoskeletal protein [Phenylobacterium sp.]|jgi:cytoskeletal protein CcmA (bactofilin family)|nr:polymer-forming cytoskeletal protein [Phenylobacterium sp.]